MKKVLNDPRGTAILVGRIVVLLVALLASPWLWQIFRAEIIYVRPTATGAGNGTSWDNATTLQDALDRRARARDEVWIAAGTHYPVVPDNPAAVTDEERKRSFRVRSGVALYGGFAGTETARDQRDPATHTTVLSGDIDQDGELDNDNSRTVVNLSNTAATTLLDGLTITGGHAEEGWVSHFSLLPSETGSGIFIGGGSPTLTNVHIVGNHGGELARSVVFVGPGQRRWSRASQPTFTDVTISENVGEGDIVTIGWKSRATFMGGMISSNADHGVSIILDSTATFSDMIISDNSGVGVATDSGSDASFTNMTISNNGRSGVYISFGGTPTFSDVTITHNGGSGVFLEGYRNANFSNVTITDNAGTGIWSWGTASLTLTDVTISDNREEGMYIDGASLICTNVSIRDNRGGDVTYEGLQPPTTCTGERP